MSHATTLEGLKEIARALKFPREPHRTTVARLIRLEGLPAFQVSGRWFAVADEVAAWLARRPCRVPRLRR